MQAKFLIRLSLLMIAFGLWFTPLRAEDAPKPTDPQLTYQTARADAAEARAALAEAQAQFNSVQAQAANVTIEYLQKLPALQAARDATAKALEAAKAALNSTKK